MKKLLALLLAMALLIPAACAEGIDLSALSFDQLVELRQQISKELTTRPEWKEVTVPVGVWKVGEDIPAGHWTITAADRGSPKIEIGKVLESNQKRVDSYLSRLAGFYYDADIRSANHPAYDPNRDIESFDIELSEGMYVVVRYAAVVFSPYAGKPSLGF